MHIKRRYTLWQLTNQKSGTNEPIIFKTTTACNFYVQLTNNSRWKWAHTVKNSRIGTIRLRKISADQIEFEPRAAKNLVAALPSTEAGLSKKSRQRGRSFNEKVHSLQTRSYFKKEITHKSIKPGALKFQLRLRSRHACTYIHNVPRAAYMWMEWYYFHLRHLPNSYAHTLAQSLAAMAAAAAAAFSAHLVCASHTWVSTPAAAAPL
jgi:hypothetical protein